jgi:hypothetical protein
LASGFGTPSFVDSLNLKFQEPAGFPVPYVPIAAFVNVPAEAGAPAGVILFCCPPTAAGGFICTRSSLLNEAPFAVYVIVTAVVATTAPVGKAGKVILISVLPAPPYVFDSEVPPLPLAVC